MSVEGINKTMTYLTFTLDDELFAVEVSKVREVLDFTTITKIPRTPEYMRGVINLRGSVVPVIDLRLKFGMSKTETKVNTCIIVLEIDMEGETVILGALADSVQEVFDLEPDQIEPAPKFGTKFKEEFLKGMGKKDEIFIIILDIDKVFSGEELILIQDSEKQGNIL
ncbi:MAG TPA: chemotaxis protein CheW [Melioribacteraceae bacterium]|nr:chemotaxis protein CheW [Melioribacteraceae bacterium]